MKKFIAAMAVCVFALSSLACFVSCNTDKPVTDNGESERESGSVEIEQISGGIGEVRTGLTKDDVSGNGEITSWIEKCHGEDRDSFGCYVLKYYEDDGNKTNCYFLLYRTGTDKKAEVDVKLDESDKFYVVTVSYTSGEGEGGYDLTYVKLVLEGDKKVLIEPVIDGEDPMFGCISTVAQNSISFD